MALTTYIQHFDSQPCTRHIQHFVFSLSSQPDDRWCQNRRAWFFLAHQEECLKVWHLINRSQQSYIKCSSINLRLHHALRTHDRGTLKKIPDLCVWPHGFLSDIGEHWLSKAKQNKTPQMQQNSIAAYWATKWGPLKWSTSEAQRSQLQHSCSSWSIIKRWTSFSSFH